MTGECELCGARGQKLGLLFLEGRPWRACPECVAQLRDCQVRRFAGGEETEPAE